MIPWLLIGIYLLFSFILSSIIGFDAQRRGLKKEDVYGWAVLTFIFSIFAMILYLVVIAPKPVLRAYCPRCGKPIQMEWKVCPNCGQGLQRKLS
jgi:hypothetical protein